MNKKLQSQKAKSKRSSLVSLFTGKRDSKSSVPGFKDKFRPVHARFSGVSRTADHTNPIKPARKKLTKAARAQASKAKRCN